MGWYRADILGNRILLTDRRGGISTPPFDSMNLALAVRGNDGVGRAPTLAHTEENRTRATLALTSEPAKWVVLRQVHGAEVIVDAVGRNSADADAVVVTQPGTVGAILVADCAPVALVGRGGVAAVHAGWRGLVAGVVEEAARAMRESGIEPLQAVVGPSIRPCCYEFGEQDLEMVEAILGDRVRGTTRSGSPALDVPAAVRGVLASVGVDRVTEVPVCTSCSPDYFSHRRDGRADGLTGRQGLLVTRLRSDAS